MQKDRTRILLAWILFLITLVPTLIFAFQPEDSILQWFQNDDAFYYFVTARNIGSGLGSTFDGIAPTNGYHPLWMLICIPIFTLLKSDLILPLRGIIIFQAFQTAGTAVLLYHLLKGLVSPEAGFFGGLFWAAAPAFYSQIAVGGLETGLNAFMLTLLLYTLYWSIEQKVPHGSRNRRILFLGFAAALAVLARLDNIFVVAFAGLWLIVRRWKADEDMYDSPWRRRIHEYLSYGLPAVLLVGTYLAINYFSFGDFVPVSGQVKHWWGELPGAPYGSAPGTLRELYIETFASKDRSIVPWSFIYSTSLNLIEKVNTWLRSAGLPAFMRTRWLVLILAALLLLDFRSSRKIIIRTGMVPLLFGAFAQILYYKLGGHVATRAWYWVMELLFTTLFIITILNVFSSLIHRIPRGAVISAILFFSFSALLLWQHIQYLDDLRKPSPESQQTPIENAAWLEANTEEGSLIGLTGSGTAGYFTTGRTIVNLDGLISSYDYFHHMQAGTGHIYLEEIGLDYVQGKPDRMLGKPPYQDMFTGRLELITLWDEADPEGTTLWAFAP
ncbi:MAG: glycosyltransferase family 39 protein [Anaerolineales bacterium]|nr:glycosyltransferase family 39 protein [Anaerolineales bacterium]